MSVSADSRGRTSDESFSQEFRLQGRRGKLDWLVGAYYLHDEVDDFITISYGSHAAAYVDRLLVGAAGIQAYGTVPGTPSLLVFVNRALATTFFVPPPSDKGASGDFSQDTDAFALFTHNEVSLTGGLTATLGLRYSNESKDLDFTAATQDTGSPFEACRFLLNNPPAARALGSLSLLLCHFALNLEVDGSGSHDRNDDAISGTAKLAFHATDDAMIYASYSRGFKSGV